MVSALAQIAVTLAAWLILMFVGTNLLGFFVRGFFVSSEMENITSINEILAKDYNKSRSVSKIINFISFALLFIFLIIIYRVWNVVLFISALMLIFSRLPGLIWEIRHGRKFQAGDMNRPRFYLLSTALSWTSLPVVWYALYGW